MHTRVLSSKHEDTCCKGMPVTTGCSGTDLIIPTLEEFCSLFHELFGSMEPVTDPLVIDHLWSCEKEGWKADWIQRVIGCDQVFTDVEELTKASAELHTGAGKRAAKRAKVTQGLLHAAGFSATHPTSGPAWPTSQMAHLRLLFHPRCGFTCYRPSGVSPSFASMRFRHRSV